MLQIGGKLEETSNPNEYKSMEYRRISQDDLNFFKLDIIFMFPKLMLRTYNKDIWIYRYIWGFFKGVTNYFIGY